MARVAQGDSVSVCPANTNLVESDSSLCAGVYLNYAPQTTGAVAAEEVQNTTVRTAVTTIDGHIVA